MATTGYLKVLKCGYLHEETLCGNYKNRRKMLDHRGASLSEHAADFMFCYGTQTMVHAALATGFVTQGSCQALSKLHTQIIGSPQAFIGDNLAAFPEGMAMPLRTPSSLAA